MIADKQPAANEELIEIDIDRVTPNRVQPRTFFDEAKLEELAQSIRENGIVQPILVRRTAGGFELVAGERRWRATQRAGLARIPAIVRDIPDDKLLELALIENIQRQELNPIEEAKAYQSLIGTLGLTHEITAARVGRDRSSVANSLRLLKLPEAIQQLVVEGKITAGHAKALLRLEKEDMLRSVARTIVDRGISVRETEALVKRLIESHENPAKPPAPTTRVPPDANFKAAETKLIRRFGTKVRIIPNQKAPGGRIEIEYYGDKDLDRVYRLLNPQDLPQDN